MAENVIAVRSSLSITTEEDETALNEVDRVPLRTKIIQVVKSAPDFTIRPARLSQELGLSVTDASAELCGLLKAVGEGSTFRFESMEGGIHTMVFSFPPDFEAKASATQRSEDWKQNLQQGLEIGLKVLKMLTAFGLILSTLIVSIAGMVAMLAAIVAISRGGDSRTRNHLSRQLHNMFLMTRQLLWCYAMFGPVGDGDQDPFFREAAYDTSLVLSLCCGNPASMWFWLRASRLRQRRRRMARGWGRMVSSDDDFGDMAGDLEGVRLIRRGSWGQEEVVPVHSSGNADEQRGLLSIAVEFLFGPTKSPGPTDADRWRMRSAVIVEKSQKLDGPSSIALNELTPFVDSPPASLNDTDKVVSEALLVVAYFNGVPAVKSSDGTIAESTTEIMAEAKFVFPELLAESTIAVRYDDPQSVCAASLDSTSRWKGLLFLEESSPPVVRRNQTSRTETPSFLCEQCMVFTALTSRQFYHCFLVAILNLVGVIWFAQSLDLGGILEQTLAPSLVQALNWGLIPVLKFYAKLFFTIPAIRLVYILVWNEFCRRRNQRRAELASQLKG